jgi:ubiquinone/menaquinone biosynthesis C-methylase UbiE
LQVGVSLFDASPAAKKIAADPDEVIMLSPELYKSSRFYDFFMKLFGYESSIDRFLRDTPMEVTGRCRVLDAGCGTGMLGLHFLERFPESELLATDLEPNFLDATLANADRRSILRSRIQTGVADISRPESVRLKDGTTMTLNDQAFNVNCVGAVLGYAADTAAALRTLVRLLEPGGILINVEMNESPSGRFVSRRYHYSNMSLQQMQNVLRAESCDVVCRTLGFRHLPAKLTRIGIIARKQISGID